MLPTGVGIAVLVGGLLPARAQWGGGWGGGTGGGGRRLPDYEPNWEEPDVGPSVFTGGHGASAGPNRRGVNVDNRQWI